MASFTDANEGEWEIEIKLGDLAGLRSCGCDLNEIARTDGGLAAFLLGDLTPFLASVWRMVRTQAELDFAAFVEAMRPESVMHARASFAAAVHEFFPEIDPDEVPSESKNKPDMRGQWIERMGWELAGVCGIDGSRLTLRQLAWAARERRRLSGELAAWHVSAILARMPFGAIELKPEAINPYRIEKPKSAELIALEKWQAEYGLKCLLGFNK